MNQVIADKLAEVVKVLTNVDGLNVKKKMQHGFNNSMSDRSNQAKLVTVLENNLQSVVDWDKK